jgi:hypothetical protein
MVMKIYRVEFDARSMSSGEGIVEFPEGFALMPPAGEPVKNWSDPSVVIPDANNWDYMPSNIGARVCSRRLFEFLNEHQNSKDYVQWLPVKVGNAHQDGNWKVLHFAKPLPVLDQARSNFLTTGALIKPAFDRALIENLAFFSIPGSYKLEFFVRDEVKKDAERRKMRGFFCKFVDEVGK